MIRAFAHVDTQQAASALPPTCPRCGSHRTEVVGRSTDGRTVTVRCLSCGERSTVNPEDERQTQSDEMADELEAMATIGRVLARLQNPASRARVLRWANERFDVEPLQGVASVFHAVAANDSSLSLDGLNYFLPMSPDRADDSLTLEDVQGDYSLTLEDMQADHLLTLEDVQADHSLTPEDVQADHSLTLEERADDSLTIVKMTTSASAPAARPGPEQPRLDVAMHTFVADFRQLASEMQALFAAPTSHTETPL